jgi:integrase
VCADSQFSCRPKLLISSANEISGSQNGELTEADTRRRRATSSDDQSGKLALQATPGDVPRRQNCVLQARVTGSNPVAPTKFTQVEGLQESQAKAPRFPQEPNKEPNGHHRDVAESRPRRGHGEDSIYYDQANHYWVAAVSLGYKRGKRVRRKVTGRTKTEVRTKLRDLRRDLDHGVRSSATYTVGDALDDWLANGLSGRSDRTRELYRDTVKALRERLGEVKLRELTAGDVQETLDALAGRFSTRSLQITRLCLERAIRHAEVRDLVGRNVAALIKAPAGRTGRPSKSLTLEQAQDLLRAAAGTRLYGYVVLSVTTGLRTEELRALRWNEVDLDAGTVAVYRAVRATADTKTPKSRRILSLPRLAVRALQEHLDRQAEEQLLAGALWQDHDLVFASAVGTPLIVTTCAASSGRLPRPLASVPSGRRGRCAILSCPCSAPTERRWRTSLTWSGTGARPRQRRSTGR